MRVGELGHSYGGKRAPFASCLHEEFACGVWSDPGVVSDEGRPNVNYWEPWYLDPEPGRTRKPGSSRKRARAPGPSSGWSRRDMTRTSRMR